MRRREFVGLGVGAVAWPVVARAQQTERMRRVGVLQGLSANDAEWLPRLAAFRQALADLGWVEGRNVTIDTRYADGRAVKFFEKLGFVRAGNTESMWIYAGNDHLMSPLDNVWTRSWP